MSDPLLVKIAGKPPPFAQPPAATGTWQEQYAAHVLHFNGHFAAQLAPRAPADFNYAVGAEENLLLAVDELYCASLLQSD
mmetsp:Transcript_12901/g.30345  ORF Transcript_12901/g.30345 Transcript_12901/m.30345 type:complete len:80 (+) Transcript_12901:104-343(+)